MVRRAIKFKPLKSGWRFVQPPSCFSSQLEHDLAWRPVPTFRDHAL